MFEFGDGMHPSKVSSTKTVTAVAWSSVMAASVTLDAKPTDSPAALFAKFSADDLEGPESEVAFTDWHPLAKLQSSDGRSVGDVARISATEYNSDFELPAPLTARDGDRQDNNFHRRHQSPATLIDSGGSTTFAHTECEKGHIVATKITERTVSSQNNYTATLCTDNRRMTAGKRPVTSDIRIGVNPVYRTAEGDTLWQQLGLDDNDWAQVAANRIIMEEALKRNANVFRPNDDGSLRRIHQLDGTPIEIDIVLEEGTQVHSKA
jgi:hypothetical protein